MKLQLSLQQRLTLAFVGMSLLVVVASAAGFYFSRSFYSVTTTTKDGFEQFQSLIELMRRWQVVSETLDLFFKTREVESVSEQINSALQAYDEQYALILDQPPGISPQMIEENQRLLGDIRLTNEEMKRTVSEVVRLASEGSWAIARDMREIVLATHQSDLNELMRQLTTNIQNDVATSFEQARRTQNLTQITTLATVLLALLAAAILAIQTTRSITNPLHNLIEVVQRVTLRDFSPVNYLPQRDEIGKLSRSIALMTDWLRQSYESLEERVTERTRELERQNVKIQVAAEIARDASSVRKLDELLNRAVNLIVERFGFYHSAIFMLDEANEYAVLHAATGPEGQKLIDNKFKLKVGQTGIVGHVAGTGKARFALDVDKDVTHFHNPLLPETRSEIALPLKVGEQVFGVLDVQSESPAAFKDDDINVLQVLSDLLAVGIHNARLNKEIQESYLELETLYGQYSQEAWKKAFLSQSTPGYQYDRDGVHALAAAPSNGKSASLAADSQQPDVVIPLKVRGQEFGTLSIWAGENELQPEDRTLIEDLGARISLSLDSARLFMDTQRRAEYERLVSQAAGKMRESLDIESVLKVAAEDIYRVLDLSALSIDLTTDTRSTIGDQ